MIRAICLLFTEVIIEKNFRFHTDSINGYLSCYTSYRCFTMGDEIKSAPVINIERNR